MTDIHSALIRSKNMAAVRSRQNRSTELIVLQMFRKQKITGWRRHDGRITGKPDFVFVKKKLALFVDGCFWHGCKKHFKVPVNNNIFWENKINTNKVRDRSVTVSLKKKGWKVIRIWEHELKIKFRSNCLRQLKNSLLSV